MLVIDRELFVDFPRREAGLVGWCAFEDRATVDDLWVECGGRRTPCLTGLPRPDVAHAHQASSLAFSGFVCRFAAPAGRAGKARLVASRGNAEVEMGKVRLARATSGTTMYGAWLFAHEPALFWPPADVKRRLRHLPAKPTISVVVQGGAAHLYHLHRCIESMTDQWYPHWELCVGDAATADPDLRKYAGHLAARDSRIRPGAGARHAVGDFVVILGAEDELHPYALVELVRCVAAAPDVDVIYSDEDRIDHAGTRIFPAFKPAFDLDFLRQWNYVGRFVAIRTSLLQRLGELGNVSDETQQSDLLVRVTSAIARERIAHVPKPLYHRRLRGPAEAGRHDSLGVRRPASLQVWRPASAGPSRLCILYKEGDGPYQRTALERSRVPAGTTFVAVGDDVHVPPADVTVVVNGPVDSVNHHCFEELAAEAWRGDCGIVAGIALGPDGRIVAAGYDASSDGTLINAAEGLTLSDDGYLRQARVVRRVASVAPFLFAFRNAHLPGAGDLGAAATSSWSDLCRSLVQSAHANGLAVLQTPYAIATLRPGHRAWAPATAPDTPATCRVNPNLETFSSVTDVLRSGVDDATDSLITAAPRMPSRRPDGRRPFVRSRPPSRLAAPFRRLLRALG